MRQRHGWPRRLACLFLVAGFAAQPALAFYPFGYFSPGGQGGELIYVKWPLSLMDINGDGDVSGPDEGIRLNFEGGVNGFTEDEIQRLFFGWEEWERVGTSYVAFSRGPDVNDPVEILSGVDATAVDGINMVALFTPGVDTSMPNATLITQFYSFVLEPTVITINNTPVLFTEPQFVETDSLYNPAGIDFMDQWVNGLEGAGTFAAGFALGLSWSPLENFDEGASQQIGQSVENRVLTLRNFQGLLELRGVTPTMRNEFFFYDLGNGVLEDSFHDLSPDDIAGVTFLYPRQDSDLFFDIVGEARTNSSLYVPSQEIAGGWIKAHVNVENNPNVRVPIIDTISGLYTPLINPNARGRFELKGLFKQLETISGNTYQANYTLTNEEFLPTVFGDIREVYDSTHGGFAQSSSLSNYTGFGFDSLFVSEVFNESGNIVGASNANLGTPLAFDIIRREVVSVTSGQSLLQIVGPERIVFGDDGTTNGPGANTGCPFNQIITAPAMINGSGPRVPPAFRGFRDNVLMRSAAGAAVADLYYRVSPSLARLIAEEGTARSMAISLVNVVGWTLQHWVSVLMVFVAALFLSRAQTLRRIERAVVTGCCAMLFFSASAEAVSLLRGMDEYVAESDHIIHGRVVATDSYWRDETHVVTDVIVNVEDAVKGRLNEDATISFQLPVGRVGAFVRYSPQIPMFHADEEVILFLDETPDSQFSIVGGVTGKYVVREFGPDGTKVISTHSVPANSTVKKAAAEIKALRENRTVETTKATSEEEESEADNADTQPSDGPVTLEEFKDYLRYLDREQRKAQP